MKVGLKMIPEGDLGDAVGKAQQAGANLLLLGARWPELEPAESTYADQELEQLALADIGFAVAWTIPVIEMPNLRLPDHHTRRALTDPALQDAFRHLLSHIMERHRKQIDYLFLGNEVDSYFLTHPEDLDAYAHFCRQTVEWVRAEYPGLPVGVIVTAQGVEKIAPAFADFVDFLTVTHYPLEGFYNVEGDVGKIETLIGGWVEQARVAGQKLFLAEVGCPSAALCLSDESRQAAYINHVFTAVERHAADVEAVICYEMYEHSQEMYRAALVEAMPGQESWTDRPEFLAYLCSLGLLHADGSPKLAWGEFSAGAQRLRA